MKTVSARLTKSLLRRSSLLTVILTFAGISPLMAEDAVAVYAHRGFAAQNKHDDATALANFDQAIRLYPKNAAAYFHRGEYYYLSRKYRMALVDLNTAMRLQPTLLIASMYRGYSNQHLGNYAQAMAEFNRLIKISPEWWETYRSDALNARAWLESTCADAHFRNAAQAISDAKGACAYTDWGDAPQLDTLAAAYAEGNDFDSAIKFEQRAISRLRNKNRIATYQSHLSLYQQHRPYREMDGKPFPASAPSAAQKAKAKK